MYVIQHLRAATIGTLGSVERGKNKKRGHQPDTPTLATLTRAPSAPGRTVRTDGDRPMTDDRFAILDYLTTEQLARIDPESAMRFKSGDDPDKGHCPMGQAIDFADGAATSSHYPSGSECAEALRPAEVGLEHDDAWMSMYRRVALFVYHWDSGRISVTDLTAELQARADRHALTDWIEQPAKVEVVRMGGK